MKKKSVISEDIVAYNQQLSEEDQWIAAKLATEITKALRDAENKVLDNKVWHAHPVWFLDGNPIVGYSRLKDSIRLMFWSGQSFEEKGLLPEGKFKAAEVRFTDVKQIKVKDLKRWLKKSIEIQWDYKNIVKRKGRLERLK